ncbi:MAG: multicopper oxidase domain-containing protein [Thiohalomonadales bacterium]
MNKLLIKSRNIISTFALAASGLAMGITDASAGAVIPGLFNSSAGASAFNLDVSAGSIPTPDGDTVLVWGYSVENQPMQYPGPTLIVNQGDVVTITLRNKLPDVPASAPPAPMPVSMIFPGQEGVGATGGSLGLLTQESTTDLDVVTYTFTAGKPGTYTYHSGTRPGLQVEMGLVGALIVRSATAGQAYNDNITHPASVSSGRHSGYDHEYLFLLTEMDPSIHRLVEFGLIALVDNTVSNPVLWFINGRNGPDTFFPDNVTWLPHQPYGSIARMRPGERVLLRVIGGGRAMHPFHIHGNNYDLIARDGNLMSTGTSPAKPVAIADLAYSDYTLPVLPGSTYDMIWQWTGVGMGWDIYGHGDDLAYQTKDQCLNGDPAAIPPLPPATIELNEDLASHCLKFPVTLPENQDLTFAGYYSGSPFLGAAADLPPGEGGLNINGGMFYMWHSHNEKELSNNDIFPGGMMTMMIVEPPSATIP